MKRWLILLLVVAIAGGAYYGVRRWRNWHQQAQAQVAAAEQPVSNTAANAVVSKAANTPGASATPNTPVATPFPGLASVTYKAPSAAEKPIIDLLTSFEKAYNQGDTTAVANLFSLSVSVTDAIASATQPTAARPVSARVMSIDIRSDNSAIAEVTEVRQVPGQAATTTVKREFEVNPTTTSYEIARYSVANTADPVSGFGSS